MTKAATIDEIDAMLPSRMLAEPSRAVTPLAPSDPARIGYPPTFPLEIALRTSSTRAVCEAYGITEDEWNRIRHEPLFLADLARAVEMLKQDGMSFRVKARMQAEEVIKTNWRLIHDPNVPPSVRAQQINATVRWAGFDNPAASNNNPVGGLGASQLNDLATQLKAMPQGELEMKVLSIVLRNTQQTPSAPDEPKLVEADDAG